MIKVIERQVIARKSVHFYKNISNYNKNSTVKHFIAKGLKRTTIHNIIQRFGKYKTTEFKLKTDRRIRQNVLKKTGKI